MPLAIVIALLPVAAWWATLDDFKPDQIASYTCPSEGSSQVSESILVHLNSPLAASIMLESICGSSLSLTRPWTFTWTDNNGALPQQRLASDPIDLVRLRPSQYENIPFKLAGGFTAIATYPNYDSYLISIQPEVAFDKSTLALSKIGLVQSQGSASGYYLPLRYLREIGLPDPHVTTYPSHAELRVALQAGEIDVIASYWGADDPDVFSGYEVSRLKIGETDGLAWYLRSSALRTQKHCEIAATLNQASKANHSEYWKNLTVVEACDG